MKMRRNAVYATNTTWRWKYPNDRSQSNLEMFWCIFFSLRCVGFGYQLILVLFFIYFFIIIYFSLFSIKRHFIFDIWTHGDPNVCCKTDVHFYMTWEMSLSCHLRNTVSKMHFQPEKKHHSSFSTIAQWNPAFSGAQHKTMNSAILSFNALEFVFFLTFFRDFLSFWKSKLQSLLLDT